MSKPAKKIGRAFDKAFIRPIGEAGRKIDREIGIKAQKDLLTSIGKEAGRGVKTVLGVPEIEQGQSSQVNRVQVIPATPIIGDQDDQMESSKELYRRRRARGMATGPAGLSTQAPVQRKTLLGE